MKVLEVKSLNTYYGESHILRNVDLTVNHSEMVCLIGRNGVGKTTLLKSLIGLLKPKKGEIIFNGNSIIRKEPHQRARSGIGYVPQGREIIPYLTVEENLLKSLSGENTVIVIDHDMEFIRRLESNVTVLNQGSVLCEGSMEQIQKDPKVIEVYLGKKVS